jgi:hypothetical protein
MFRGTVLVLKEPLGPGFTRQSFALSVILLFPWTILNPDRIQPHSERQESILLRRRDISQPAGIAPRLYDNSRLELLSWRCRIPTGHPLIGPSVRQLRCNSSALSLQVSRLVANCPTLAQSSRLQSSNCEGTPESTRFRALRLPLSKCPIFSNVSVFAVQDLRNRAYSAGRSVQKRLLLNWRDEPPQGGWEAVLAVPPLRNIH